MSTADEVEQAVALRDPELVEAAREVDQTLLRWSLGLTPLERLRACTQATSTLERLRHASLAHERGPGAASGDRLARATGLTAMRS